MAPIPSHIKTVKTLLVKNGFIKAKEKGKYTFNENKQEWVLKAGGGIDSKDADIESAEEVNIGGGAGYIETDYPASARRYRLIYESPGATIEEPYYWILEHIRQDFSHPYVEKIIDTYAGSEQSSFWGAIQARVGIQQDRASQYLRGISEMVKQLFQLVRELRILDEKLEPRNKWQESAAADLALKGEYTDLVENRGGQIQPGSVYHLSQSVGYAVLPDMFFNTRIYKTEDIDKIVDEQYKGYNANVRNVLKRKMYAFINWKEKTDAELRTRRLFTLRYVRQHWNTIKMYMNWVKPYLRNIQRLQMNPQDIESPELVGAFESSVIEIEFVAYKPAKKGVYSISMFSFKFRTRPELSYQKDQYAHKGPIHVGRMEVTMRSYGWTEAELESYKRLRQQEDMILLGFADESVKAAMEALGEDLEKYLAEAGEKEFEEKKKEKEAAEKKKKEEDMKKSQNMLEPFTSVFSGFKELGGALFGPMGGTDEGKKSKLSDEEEAAVKKDQAKSASGQIFNVYKNFKKSHGLLSW
jgi:hypothetical protein